MTVLMVALALVLTGTSYAAIEEDRGIVSADIAAVYTGRTYAEDMLGNLNFQDVQADYWGKEAIMRMGALDITKGYIIGGVRQFRPTSQMSKEEALAFIMRAIGLEEAAKQAAETIPAVAGESTVDFWSKGYLSLAFQQGLITAAELGDALVPDQTVLDSQFNFIRTEPVSREQVAKWLVIAINNQNPDLIAPIYRQQNVYTFDDFEQMDPLLIPYIEAVVEEQIMVGDGTSFNPKDKRRGNFF